MKTLTSLTVLFIFCSLHLFGQNMEEMQKAYEKAMTPGKEHKMLSEMAGKWKTTTTTYMMGQKTVSEGSMSAEMILGGRYLHSVFMGTMNGMPFQGENLEGYDNVKQKFSSVWVDDMGTGLTVSEGSYDEKTGTLVYTGKSFDPMTGTDMTFKNTYKKIGENKYLFSMFMISDGQEVKMMDMEIYK